MMQKCSKYRIKNCHTTDIDTPGGDEANKDEETTTPMTDIYIAVGASSGGVVGGGIVVVVVVVMIVVVLVRKTKSRQGMYTSHGVMPYMTYSSLLFHSRVK